MDNKIIDNLKCYIDLHLHLDGSLPLSTVKKLIKLNGMEELSDLELNELLACSNDNHDLNEYLKKFEFPLSLLQTKDSIKLAVKDLLDNLYNDGLIYAEIRFAPQLHLTKSLTQDMVVEAAIEGLKESKLKSNLILCLMRGNDNYKLNKDTIDVANHYLGKGVCAIDLAGAEGLYPTASFKDLFLYASSLNIPFTIHAGEADSYKSVNDAIAFGAKRIGHGIHSLDSFDTINMLKSNNICLELCPKSNIDTKAVDSIINYPFKRLKDYGIKITLNTDDMTVSNTNIRNEYKLINSIYDLTNDDILWLLNNSVDYAFISNKEKEELKEIINKEFKNIA